MYKKPAVICLLMLSLLLYCSCLKREHTHPLDPVTKGGGVDTPTPVDTPTLVYTPTLVDTPTNTVPPTDTLTPSNTVPPTETPTNTVEVPDAWLDRGEVTGDLPGGSGSSESRCEPAVYPNMTHTSAPGVLEFSGNGFMWWSPGCTSCISDSSTGMAYNYSSDFYAGTGSLRLTGKMAGYTWGGWGAFELSPCGDWSLVDISAYTGLEFYGKKLSGNGDVTLTIDKPFFDDIQYDDDWDGNLDSYQYISTTVGSWNLHEVPFVFMDSGWPTGLPITGPPFNRYTPGTTNLKTTIVRVGPGTGPYDFLIDEFKFY